MKKILLIVVLALQALVLAGCSGVSFSQWHFPYMMEVQQGTYITNEQYKSVLVGMTKDQVAYTLGGKPIVQSMFNQKRWDFVYQDYKNNKLNKDYHVTIFFDANDLVSSVIKQGELFDK